MGANARSARRLDQTRGQKARRKKTAYKQIPAPKPKAAGQPKKVGKNGTGK